MPAVTMGGTPTTGKGHPPSQPPEASDEASPFGLSGKDEKALPFFYFLLTVNMGTRLV